MITFKLQTISYDQVSSIIQKVLPTWSPGDIIQFDETLLTVDELNLFTKYLEQLNYKQDV